MSVDTITIDADGTVEVIDLNQGPTGPAGNSILGAEFISPEQSVPASATVLELTHSLGSVPKSFQWVARCKSAENGYAVGDEIDVTTNSHSSGRLSLYANATKVDDLEKAVASAVAALTPTPKDDGLIKKITGIIDLLALNVGKAKDK